MRLLRIGLVQYETAMELTKFLGNDTDHVVWKTVFTSLNKLVIAEFSTGGALESFKVTFTYITSCRHLWLTTGININED